MTHPPATMTTEVHPKIHGAWDILTKRAAFGFTSFRNYRVRSLLYAGKPNWGLLATIAPR